MPKRKPNTKLNTKSRKSELIEELDVSQTRVGKDIVEDPEQIQVSRKKHELPKEAEPYKWKPGQSGNPGGRPPDIVKAIALRMGQLKLGKILSAEELEKLKKLNLDAASMTVLEGIILDWATSTNPLKQAMFIERIAGKVPNINLNAQINENIVQRFYNKLTDAELERIKGGEDALDILLEKLPDVEDAQVIDAEEE